MIIFSCKGVKTLLWNDILRYYTTCETKVKSKLKGFTLTGKLSRSKTICKARIRIFVRLYSGKDSDSFTDLRYVNYVTLAPSSRTIKPEFTSIWRSCYVSCILGIFPTLRVKHTHGKYPGSKRLGWRLVDTFLVPVMMDEVPSQNELLTMQLPSDVEKSVRWKTVFLPLQWYQVCSYTELNTKMVKHRNYLQRDKMTLKTDFIKTFLTTFSIHYSKRFFKFSCVLCSVLDSKSLPLFN